MILIKKMCQNYKKTFKIKKKTIINSLNINDIYKKNKKK